MKYGIYFKQVWNLIRQESLFSLIYIIGTALSISMVMILFIILYIKIAPVYPENTRDRLLVLKRAAVLNKEGGGSYSSFSEETVNTCFRSMETAEAVSAIRMDFEDYFLQPPGRAEQLPVTLQFVDDKFWNVFSFRFIDGYPFKESDFLSGIQTAVISESLAKSVFGDIEVSGKYISVNFREYRVAGVVKDVSFITPLTFANIWVPYTVDPEYKDIWESTGTLGSHWVCILAPTSGDIEKVRAEAIGNFQKYASVFPDVEVTIFSQPDVYWKSLFRQYTNEDINVKKIFFQYGMLVLVLLLVPAVSLSGMIDSRMERRMSELGVRRAFGASNTSVVRQVVGENLLFTLLGGVFGLVFSLVVVYVGRTVVFSLGAGFIESPLNEADAFITPGMLFNMPVFISALLICILLNLFSALIPAWRASRKEIVWSINNQNE